MTADPELHTFEVAPITERDNLDTRDGHKLVITNPTHGASGWTQSSIYALGLDELADLRDLVTDYLEDIRIGPGEVIIG